MARTRQSLQSAEGCAGDTGASDECGIVAFGAAIRFGPEGVVHWEGPHREAFLANVGPAKRLRPGQDMGRFPRSRMAARVAVELALESAR